ncbi:MAG: D-aminoacyl-tRNA deacylase [Leeuwenhoekiella sp.]
MKVVVQRVKQASVTIDGNPHTAIEKGLLILLGIAHEDTKDDIDWLVRKISGMRIFGDDQGLMNLNVNDIRGEVLVVSQFTLLASTRKGNRPSFIEAAKPDQAVPLYKLFLSKIGDEIMRPVQAGIFGANMQVHLVNDGPVTIVVDTRSKK